MNREEAIIILKEHHDHWMRLYKEGICTEEEGENTIESLEMAIKALEREQQKYTRPRHCDCCGVLLTEENNKCGYELCDSCNERLEQSMERGRHQI